MSAFVPCFLRAVTLRSGVGVFHGTELGQPFIVELLRPSIVTEDEKLVVQFVLLELVLSGYTWSCAVIYLIIIIPLKKVMGARVT